MKSEQNFSSIQRLLAGALTIALCGSPSLMAQTAATTTDSQSQTPAATTNTNTTQTTPDAPVQDPRLGSTESAMPDPSRGPQKPALQQQQTNSSGTTNLPNAPAATNTDQQVKKPANTDAYQEPSGAAVAQRGATDGGAASRPAGTAIAPAKQRRVRSLVIKVGAAVAGAAALGTVYALSRGTSSTPPGAVHNASAVHP